MMRPVLFLMGLSGLPLIWSLGEAFLRGLAQNAGGDPLFFTPGFLAFAGGALGMLLAYAFFTAPLKLCAIFAHELTHAVVGLCCGARIHSFSVTSQGGAVTLDKMNLFIALSPYCLPLYLLLALLISAPLLHAFPALPFWPFAALFGALTLFHLLATLDSLLTTSQSDLHLYGRLFSYWLILTVNLLAANLALPLANRQPLRTQFIHVATTTSQTYRTLAQTLRHALLPLTRRIAPNRLS